MKDLTKTILFCTAFFILFFSLGAYNYTHFSKVSGSNDFNFHWEKAHDLNLHPEYPSGFHLIWQYFTTNELFFYSMILLIICFAIPLVILFSLKSFSSTILYFLGTSLTWMWVYGATYPQAIIFLLVVIYFAFRKKVVLFLVLTIISFFLHREGIYLFALIGLAELVNHFFKPKLDKLLESSKSKIYLASGTVLATQKFFDIPHYLFFVLTQISVPLWFYAKKIIFEPFWLILCIVPLAFLNYDARLISLTQISLVFVVTPQIKFNKKTIFALIVYSIFFFLEFGLGTINLAKR